MKPGDRVAGRKGTIYEGLSGAVDKVLDDALVTVAWDAERPKKPGTGSATRVSVSIHALKPEEARSNVSPDHAWVILRDLYKDLKSCEPHQLTGAERNLIARIEQAGGFP